jgi:hypothetical protein
MDGIFPPKPTWPNFVVPQGLYFACLLGAVANLLLIGGWMAFYISRRKRKRPIVARWMARCSFVLMFASVVAVACVGCLAGIYPGFGLWAASALMLVLRY